MGRIGGLAKAVVKWAGLPGIVLLSSFHMTAWTQQAISEHKVKDDPLRVQFKQEFGFPLRGPREAVDVPRRVADIANALTYADATNISALSILPDEYLRRPWYRQAEQTSGAIATMLGSTRVEFDNSGRYFEDWPVLPDNRLEVEGKDPAAVMIHEIGHAKIDKVLTEHPSFEKEWLDASGVKARFYQPLRTQANFYLNFVDVPNDPAEREAYNKLGFSAKVSTMHWKEDAADLIADAERAMLFFFDTTNSPATRYLRWLEGNPEVVRQTQLLQRHGVLPRELSEALELQREYREAWGTRIVDDKTVIYFKSAEEAKDFLEKSAVFLKEHPDTGYGIQMRYARAKLYWELAKGRTHPWPNQQAAISELIAGLRSDEKELLNYRNSLGLLKVYAFTIGDRDLEKLCAGAMDEHDRRYDANDVTLPRTGVQEYLAKHDSRFR